MRYAWTPKFELSGPTVPSYTVTSVNTTISGEVRSIAEAAINSINQQLLLNQTAAVNVQSRQSSALTELQRRFPTVSRARECSGRYVSANRSSNPYSTTTPRRRVGRPTTNDVVVKDVLIVDAGQDKVPTRLERVELERKGRVISGFDVDRKWNPTNLQLHLSG